MKSQKGIFLKTRMHSSRMRTGRSLTVCWSLLPGGVWSRGGVWSGGCLVRGGLSQHALRQTPPVDRQTPVKILPWPNFVAAGKNIKIRKSNLNNTPMSPRDGKVGKRMKLLKIKLQTYFYWCHFHLLKCSTHCPA